MHRKRGGGYTSRFRPFHLESRTSHLGGASFASCAALSHGLFPWWGQVCASSGSWQLGENGQLRTLAYVKPSGLFFVGWRRSSPFGSEAEARVCQAGAAEAAASGLIRSDRRKSREMALIYSCLKSAILRHPKRMVGQHNNPQENDAKGSLQYE